MTSPDFESECGEFLCDMHHSPTLKEMVAFARQMYSAGVQAGRARPEIPTARLTDDGPTILLSVRPETDGGRGQKEGEDGQG